MHGILDQPARYEKAKLAQRTRRGKLRKAREGKVIARCAASYGRAAFGFRYNESRDGPVLDEERIPFVKRMFYSTWRAGGATHLRYQASPRGCLRSPHSTPFANLLSIRRIIVT